MYRDLISPCVENMDGVNIYKWAKEVCRSIGAVATLSHILMERVTASGSVRRDLLATLTVWVQDCAKVMIRTVLRFVIRLYVRDPVNGVYVFVLASLFAALGTSLEKFLAFYGFIRPAAQVKNLRDFFTGRAAELPRHVLDDVIAMGKAMVDLMHHIVTKMHRKIFKTRREHHENEVGRWTREASDTNADQQWRDAATVRLEQARHNLDTFLAAESPVATCTDRVRETGALCPICFDDFEAGQKVVCLRCSHVFHHECFLPWHNGPRSQSKTCPLCRAHAHAGIYETQVVQGGDSAAMLWVPSDITNASPVDGTAGPPLQQD